MAEERQACNVIKFSWTKW